VFSGWPPLVALHPVEETAQRFLWYNWMVLNVIRANNLDAAGAESESLPLP